jgi:hypothetical protein
VPSSILSTQNNDTGFWTNEENFSPPVPGGEFILTQVQVRGALNFQGATIDSGFDLGNQYGHGIYVGATWPGWNAGQDDAGWLMWGAIEPGDTTLAYAPASDSAYALVRYNIRLDWRGQRPVAATSTVFWGWAIIADSTEPANAGFTGTILYRYDTVSL